MVASVDEPKLRAVRVSAGLTRLTNTQGLLTKTYELVNGQLVKRTTATLYEGAAQRVSVKSLRGLTALIAELKPNEGLCYGIASRAQATITTKARKERLPGTIARCGDDFKWPKGPGVLFIDGDADYFSSPVASAAEFHRLLLSIAPELVDAPMLILPSASSYIYHGDQQLVGARGYHAYLLVQNAQDIPRAGVALYERSWSAGHGSVRVSANGSLLERSVIDQSVWQAERIDFAAGAQCTPPLEQRRPAPYVVGDPEIIFDSSRILDPTPAELERIQSAKQKARAAKRTESEKLRGTYVEAQAKVIRARTAITHEEAIRTVRRALEGCALGSDFVLYPHEGDPLTVREVLADAERWHGARFADPIEPEYREDTRIAYLNLAGATGPYLFSHAHGGRVFTVSDTDSEWKKRLRVEGKQGARIKDEENVLIVLQRDPVLTGLARYDEFKGELVLAKQIPGTEKTGEYPRRWMDTDSTALTAYIQRSSLPRISRDKTEAGIALVAQERGAFNPLRDLLQGLKWDGIKRVSTWLTTYLGAHGAPITYLQAVGSAALIGGAARALRPGCKNDCALVLEGPQGIKKSMLARVLALRDEWFSDSLPADLAHKDAKDHLRGKWIVELPELAQFRRSEIETVKSFMARQVEQYRPAYGRHEIEVPRTCWFIGSTNDAEYLVDPTGNRRFWPIKCGDIDIDALIRDREQLWAEAVQRFRAGEVWYLSEGIAKQAAVEQQKRFTADPWLPLVVKALPVPRVGEVLQISPGEVLEGMEVQPSQRHASAAARVGRILADLGWKKTIRDGRRGQLYEFTAEKIETQQ